MKNQQTFSHGLLYSIAPEDLPALHLREEEGLDGFDWENEPLSNEYSFARAVLNFLRASMSRK